VCRNAVIRKCGILYHEKRKGELEVCYEMDGSDGGDCEVRKVENRTENL